MRFDAEHRFGAPPDAVRRVLADPSFYAGLELPDVGRPELVENHATGDGVRLVLRYAYTGHLDPMAGRVLGSSTLSWTQELRLEGSAGSLTFLADADPRLLHGEATFSLEAVEAGTIRTLSGELVVALPVIGAVAERRIVPGVLQRLDLEAEAIQRVLGTA